MTREKKIFRDKEIENYFYLFITKQQAWDYWLEPYLFYQIAYTINCSVHKVKRVFYKVLLPNPDFKAWLQNFEY